MSLLDRLSAIDEKHGPLPVLLLGLTILTGMVDAVSYLGLGHVFVANMTGNVVFLGFAAAGVTGFSIPSSLAAIAAFLIGAFLGGVLNRGRPGHRGYLFWQCVLLELILVTAAFTLSMATIPDELAIHYGLILLLGVTMGLQNAIVRRLSVPDLTTTVLTLTLTGLAADMVPASGSTRLRRLLSVAAMFLGAAAGGLLLLRFGISAVMAAALVLTAIIAVLSYHGRQSSQAWTAGK